VKGDGREEKVQTLGELPLAWESYGANIRQGNDFKFLFARGKKEGKGKRGEFRKLTFTRRSRKNQLQMQWAALEGEGGRRATRGGYPLDKKNLTYFLP